MGLEHGEDNRPGRCWRWGIPVVVLDHSVGEMPKARLHSYKRRENNHVRKGPTEWISYLVLILDLSWGPVGTEESLGTCSPAFLKGFLPIAVCSLAMDASFSLVEKKWIQIQIWEGAIICSACGNYVCIPH